MGVGGQRNATPRPLWRIRDPLPLVEEAEGIPEPVWTGAENLAPLGFDPRAVQPVASRYTDYAMPAHRCHNLFLIFQSSPTGFDAWIISKASCCSTGFRRLHRG